jgi:TatD DNase family protein
MLLDSHAHLDGPQFAADRDVMIARAHDSGIQLLLAIGNGDGPDDLACALPFAERYDWVYASCGVHPHEAKLVEERHYAELLRLAAHPKLIAIGEIGLDYWYEHSPRDLQQQVFRRQLAVAAEAKLPILIHCRPSQAPAAGSAALPPAPAAGSAALPPAPAAGSAALPPAPAAGSAALPHSSTLTDAWDDLLRILHEDWAATGLGGVMHCFTGDLAQARASLDLGFLLSFAGNLTYPKALNIQEAARMVPLDRYLLETDCPYLAPVPHRGQRNEPAYVADTTRYFASLRGITQEEAGEQAVANFRRLFNPTT